ncbi:hypothetical protein MLD38_003790 [Melastoma candidum]|uniref:Uncharacterized protein n=1 Tax=Melastoma candidum TaxID=119954 RepID=A0ACB9S3K2_9MYRT|nr:hypothetical protein MLD38_003790 [Melastoma candidum]
MKSNPIKNRDFLHGVCKDSSKIGKNRRSSLFSESYEQSALYTALDYPLTISDIPQVEDLGLVTNETKPVGSRETVREDALDSAKSNCHSSAANHSFLNDSSFLNQSTPGVEDFRPLNLQIAEVGSILSSQIPGFASDSVFASTVMEDYFMLPPLEEVTDEPFGSFHGSFWMKPDKYLQSDSEEMDMVDPISFIRNSLNISYMEANSPPTLLSPKANQKRTTLVLDLDETLVHSTMIPCSDADFSFRIPINKKEETMYVRRRPFLRAFLERVSELFEIILFTASQGSYAKPLLNHLDPEGKFFSRHAFRDSCVLADGIFTKDLKVLGVDLAKVAIVDNIPEVYRWQVNNGIPIKSWYDDPLDTELMSLLPFLEMLVDVDDVRPLIEQKFSRKGQ